MGFHNTHAICYFNALIQSLLSCEQWVEWALCKRLEPNMKLLDQFFTFIESSQWDTLFPLRLLQSMQKVASNQSSSEYFLHLLDAFPAMEKLFTCTFEFQQQCRACGHQTTRRDISSNPLISTSLQELFDFNEEIADLLCSHCNTRQTHMVHRSLMNSPRILAVSLNKYMHKRSVACPLEFQSESFTYRLKACIDHRGVLGAGHYVARVSRMDRAVLADDLKMMELPAMDAQAPDIYMMFYERHLH